MGFDESMASEKHASFRRQYGIRNWELDSKRREEQYGIISITRLQDKSVFNISTLRAGDDSMVQRRQHDTVMAAWHSCKVTTEDVLKASAILSQCVPWA
jgi:hypothetical protein